MGVLVSVLSKALAAADDDNNEKQKKSQREIFSVFVMISIVKGRFMGACWYEIVRRALHMTHALRGGDLTHAIQRATARFVG